MPTDEDGRAFLLCSECLRPVYFDSNQGAHACSCSDEPAGYRMGEKSEVIAQMNEFEPILDAIKEILQKDSLADVDQPADDLRDARDDDQLSQTEVAIDGD